ncbi:hypothetical protein ACFO5K_00265 [Nocardia halotolerans]|uniref:Uncharacterized protein n=1 Tax=Nocardia halotolerans TaxID=1755878 RepID=A0ABV8V9E9_9NOCA
MRQNGIGETGRGAGGAVFVSPAEFVGIDRACTEFLDVIDRVRTLSAQIGDQAHWGLGEGDARLISGPALVARLRATASGHENSIGVAMDAHERIVADLRRAHRIVRDRMTAADAEWAGRFRDSAAGAHDRLASWSQ